MNAKQVVPGRSLSQRIMHDRYTLQVQSLSKKEGEIIPFTLRTLPLRYRRTEHTVLHTERAALRRLFGFTRGVGKVILVIDKGAHS